MHIGKAVVQMIQLPNGSEPYLIGSLRTQKDARYMANWHRQRIERCSITKSS